MCREWRTPYPPFCAPAAPSQAARDALDSSMSSLWYALGYAEPSLASRLMHGLKARLGLAPPTAGERMEAAIDAAGNTLMGAGAGLTQGVFARLRDAVGA
jgi:hypothetical protein